MHKELHKACMIRLNSIAADIKPMLDAQAIYGFIRNMETSKIRILLYKQPPNCAHTMTYVSTVLTADTKRGNQAPFQKNFKKLWHLLIDQYLLLKNRSKFGGQNPSVKGF